jgi:hypothetical protein
MFTALVNGLEKQIQDEGLYGEVEILSNSRMGISTGKKRNELINESKGEFIVFIDDDDEVYDWYVKEIYGCLKKNPKIDCVGINGVISFSGTNHKQWFISKEYGHWYETPDAYFRTPNHISPVRKSIASAIGFPDMHHGEDFTYAMGILPLLKHEEKIDKPLYHYKFVQPYQPPSSNESNAPYRPAFR